MNTQPPRKNAIRSIGSLIAATGVAVLLVILGNPLDSWAYRTGGRLSLALSQAAFYVVVAAVAGLAAGLLADNNAIAPPVVLGIVFLALGLLGLAMAVAERRSPYDLPTAAASAVLGVLVAPGVCVGAQGLRRNLQQRRSDA